jgi:hypothetical protein
MSYVVRGVDSAGALSLKRDSAAGAVKKALELMDDGTLEVQITDPQGRVYRSSEFAALRDAKH